MQTLEGRRTLETLHWDNQTLRRLPVLPAEHAGRVDEPRTKVPGVCFSPAAPTPLKHPRLVVVSESALHLLGLDPAEAERRAEEYAEFFGGNRVLPGAEPAAHCYCGHQFGHFAGQLGDGATMYLGEVINPQGERWEVQFKGAGRTHYSRSADGRKVLRSSLRELLASEAAHALGIPTTRAGTLVTSDTRVERDMHYNGNVVRERASVILRIAPSFLRFGSFEVCKPRDAITGREGPSVGQPAVLEQLMSHVAELVLAPPVGDAPAGGLDAGLPFDSSLGGRAGGSAGGSISISTDSTTLAADEAIGEEAAGADGSSGGLSGGSDAGASALNTARQQRWQAAFEEMVLRTARLVACWHSVGFCHGVLNTDNMSVLGLTLDYGPFGYMGSFDPDYACNGSDSSGRYTYAEQPAVCHWNCERLADALAPLLPRRCMQPALDAYQSTFEAAFLNRMRRKLGLRLERPTDTALVESLFATMRQTGADFTCTFRALCAIDPPAGNAGLQPLIEAITARCPTSVQLASAAEARARDLRGSLPMPLPHLMQLLQMAQANPAALSMFGDPAQVQAELSDAFAKVQKASQLAEQAQSLRAQPPEQRRQVCVEHWMRWMIEYRQRLDEEDGEAAAQTGGSAVDLAASRREAMRRINPRVVLRNWVAQEAIDAAERGDFAHVRQILDVVTHPYEDRADGYGEPPPEALASLCVT